MNQNSFILQSGYKPMGIAFAISIISFLFICDTLGFIALLVFLFLGYIHRNSIVGFIPQDDNIIVAPIEGKITTIDVLKHSYKIYIDVGLCDAHILRTPKKAHYSIKKLIHGLNLPHTTYKGKKLNSRATLKFDDVKLKLISGLCNKRLDFITDQNVTLGDTVGLFFHGQISIEIPKDIYKLNVVIGDKLNYETQLAEKIETE